MSDNKSKLSVGDEVRLPSGGPRMTVTSLYNAGLDGDVQYAEVQFFDNATLHRHRLPVEALEKAGS